jgi:hypothetical protein
MGIEVLLAQAEYFLETGFVSANYIGTRAALELIVEDRPQGATVALGDIGLGAIIRESSVSFLEHQTRILE